MKFTNMTIMLLAMITFLTLLGYGDNLFVAPMSLFGVSASTGSVDSADVTDSSIWTLLFNGTTGLLIGLGVGLGAVIAGLFGKTININLIVLPFMTTILGAMGAVTWTVINSVGGGWGGAIIGFIFSIIGALYVASAIEFFFGTD